MFMEVSTEVGLVLDVFPILLWWQQWRFSKAFSSSLSCRRKFWWKEAFSMCDGKYICDMYVIWNHVKQPSKMQSPQHYMQNKIMFHALVLVQLCNSSTLYTQCIFCPFSISQAVVSLWFISSGLIFLVGFRPHYACALFQMTLYGFYFSFIHPNKAIQFFWIVL